MKFGWKGYSRYGPLGKVYVGEGKGAKYKKYSCKRKSYEKKFMHANYRKKLMQGKCSKKNVHSSKVPHPLYNFSNGPSLIVNPCCSRLGIANAI